MRVWRRGLALFLCCIGLLAAGPSSAQWRQWGTPEAGAPADEATVLRRAMAANLFVFFHEVGHGLIAELDLPAVGREEDVVDQFAAYFLVRWSEVDPGLDQVLGDAVDSWRLSHIQMQSEGRQPAYWGEHGFDLQRYYNILCFMVGANPAKWEALRLAGGLPDRRAERCPEEYRKARRAWDRILDPHLVKPGERPPATRGRMRVAYPAVTGEFYISLRDAYMSTRFLEEFAAVLNELIVLPNDILIVPQTCGEANAFWVPDGRRIVMCYELVEWFVTLYRNPAALGYQGQR